jgi:DNA mismatch repair ATPase MutS
MKKPSKKMEEEKPKSKNKYSLIKIGEIFRSSKPLDIHEELKREYPEHIIFIRCGFYYEVWFEDAEKCQDIFDWDIGQRGGKSFSGVGKQGIRAITEKLEGQKIPYILVEQVKMNNTVEREFGKKYD